MSLKEDGIASTAGSGVLLSSKQSLSSSSFRKIHVTISITTLQQSP